MNASSEYYLLCRQEVDVQQLPLTIHEWQESDGDVVVSVQVGASAPVVIAVVLHGHQGGEVAPCVAQGDGALPTEALLPQQRQVHTYSTDSRISLINSVAIEDKLFGSKVCQTEWISAAQR